jgi:hypothetical protein
MAGPARRSHRWILVGVASLATLAWCSRWYDDYLRWLYRGGRPSRFARVQNQLSADRLRGRDLATASGYAGGAGTAQRAPRRGPGGDRGL